MNRRSFLKASAAGLAASCFPHAARAQADSKPSFVFVLADDLGWADLGCYGSTFYETPNLDRLARRGVRFTDAYAACPVCSPTRASIMSGKYPGRMHATDWFGAPQPDESLEHPRFGKLPLLGAQYTEHLPLEEVTVAEALQSAGYKTFFAGKWHLGGEEWLPTAQGFDINQGGHDRGSPPGGYFSPYNNPYLEDGPEGEHLPARLAGETVRFIEAAGSEQPFLAYLSFYSVHTPLQAREDLERKYARKAAGLPEQGPVWGEEGERKERLVQDHAVYAGMVEAMDAAVGEVLAALEREGLAENTVIIFTSDNGGLSTSEGRPTSNQPLRAGKGWLYEGGIRVPLIIRWPGVADRGMVCREPVSSPDYYPTMLRMAGLPLRPEQHLDGADLTPLLRDAQPPARDALFWHYPHYGNQGGAPGSAIREGRWKLIEWFEDDSLELYDLESDIGEEHNLAAERPEMTRRLHARLQAWREEVDANMPTPNPTV